MLRVLGDEPLGSWFASRMGEVRALLETRNHSILAHGNSPIDEAVFRSDGRRLIDLCREALGLLRIGARTVALQLPRTLPEDSSGGVDAQVSGAAQASLKPVDTAAVGEFADRVRSALGTDVLDIRLFGSKATGRDAPDSDIDILVVVAEARPDVEERILAIAFDVNLAHDVFISPSVVGRATLEDRVWRITPFLRAALAGIPV